MGQAAVIEQARVDHMAADVKMEYSKECLLKKEEEEMLARQRDIDQDFMEKNEALKRQEREVKFTMKRHGMPTRSANQAAIGATSAAAGAPSSTRTRYPQSALGPSSPLRIRLGASSPMRSHLGTGLGLSFGPVLSQPKLGPHSPRNGVVV